MLPFVITGFAVMASILIITHLEQVLACQRCGILLGILGSSILWFAYLLVCFVAGVYHALLLLGAVLERYHYLMITVVMLVFLGGVYVFSLAYAKEAKPFCDNIEMLLGGQVAVMLDGVSESKQVGLLQGGNGREFRCMAEHGETIAAGSQVVALQCVGTKVVVRLLSEEERLYGAEPSLGRIKTQ